MPTLTVRNIDEDLMHRLLIRAAAHGRSVEAEHREILHAALRGAEQSPARQQAVERLAEFRCRTAGRGSSATTDLLKQSRAGRTQSLTAPDDQPKQSP